MAKRKSFTEGFKVEETKGKAAEGDHSLLTLNNAIAAATCEAEVFSPMWELCLVCANQRKLISKVRGDSNDFLTYATLAYINRWQKQFAPPDARRPVQFIQNWIPYILNTIRFTLINFNKDVYDYDFLPLPTILEDGEGAGDAEKEVPDYSSRDPILAMAVEELASVDTVHSLLTRLPAELHPYLLDILYYIRTDGLLVSKKTLNFVKIGRSIFTENVERWVRT